ncbi:Prefoldin [Phlyctochytrium arcticum]|nr:Prefoldin [Phlyctochytrium arcticum]
MAAVQLEKEMAAFQSLQKEFAKVVQSRAQLDSQLKENEMVAKEFELVNEDTTVYKLIGPVLVKQEKAEATVNVKKRIEFITNEIKRLEGQISELEKKQESKRNEVIKLQQLYQQEQSQGSS